MAEDFFAVLLAYPAAALQMDEHMLDMESEKKNDIPMGTVITNTDVNIHEAEIAHIPQKSAYTYTAYTTKEEQTGYVATVQVGDHHTMTHI